MEEVDDDFSDLYADDVQIPAISDHLYNTHLPFKKIAGSSCQIFAHSGNVFQDSTEESHRLAAYDNDTSDDDDLKIVLNDDCNVVAPVITVNGGLNVDEENGDFDGYDNVGNLQRTNNWSNPDDRVFSHNGADTGYMSGHLHYKYSSLQRMDSKANGEDCLLERSASEVAQNCLAFSLPWYRTIFDVNVCTFEHKPWTFPGADVSNYFNFGFDEKGWKHYCNQLDNLRRLKSPLSNHYSRLKAYEVGASEHGEEMEEVSSAFLNETQGSAIQVQESTVDRQPSIDAKWSTDRDSEAIQVYLFIS
ncbi:FIP1[III]-like protein [Impatiens glandulifera]|uniref:FIP1[III]-like protein n=1 Tax=Impatiens glandulifera TaxID=253017 RepID=UPI001FB098CA|nr:FIP1[III]-like protein [Impatiens glandulifera]